MSATHDALIAQCDICGNITAIDMVATPENERAMQYPDRTVLKMPKEEALALWEARAKRCDHKALIASLRDALNEQATAVAP